MRLSIALWIMCHRTHRESESEPCNFHVVHPSSWRWKVFPIFSCCFLANIFSYISCKSTRYTAHFRQTPFLISINRWMDKTSTNNIVLFSSSVSYHYFIVFLWHSFIQKLPHIQPRMCLSCRNEGVIDRMQIKILLSFSMRFFFIWLLQLDSILLQLPLMNENDVQCEFSVRGNECQSN